MSALVIARLNCLISSTTQGTRRNRRTYPCQLRRGILRESVYPLPRSTSRDLQSFEIHSPVSAHGVCSPIDMFHDLVHEEVCGLGFAADFPQSLNQHPCDLSALSDRARNCIRVLE